MRFDINEEVSIRVTGYQASPGYYDKTRIDPPIICFEIGASCGARGTYGIHLSPELARKLAEALMVESAKATGSGS